MRRSPNISSSSSAPGQETQATPEQQLAVAVRAAHVLVSASAGTGKTRTLIDRMLDVIRSGIALDRLLAITFTQKAAQEIKERLYEAFSKDEQLRPLRLLLPQSHVSTIDSFCSRLLRENAVPAGVDPSFRVLSPPHDQLVIAEILNDIFHHWYLGRPESRPENSLDWEGIPKRKSTEHKEFLRLVELCGYREGQEILKLEINHLMRLSRVHPDPAEFVAGLDGGLQCSPPPYVEAYARMLADTWTQALSVYAAMLNVADEKCPEQSFSRHIHFLESLSSAPAPWRFETEPEQRVAILTQDLPGAIGALRRHLEKHEISTPGRWNLKFPSLPRGSGPLLAPWNDLAKELIGTPSSGRTPAPFGWLPERSAEILSQYEETRETLETLLNLLRQLMTAYESYKQERGLLDFADLELCTRRLLRDPPDGLPGKFDMVLVDEFQDVNRLQADIVDLLQPAEGRFLVGDIKQCIYQFRLSDPSIFRALFDGAKVLSPRDLGDGPEAWKREIAGTQRARLFLSRNFRSRYPLLQAVNSLFGLLFTPEMIGGDYADEALAFGARGGMAAEQCRELLDSRPSIADGRAANGTQPGWAPVEFHLIDKHPKNLGISQDATVVLEATLAAQRIRSLVQDEFPIYDRKLKEWRPIRYGDIAVILRSPGPTGTAYARTLRAHGLPVAFGGSDFFTRREVRDFLNLVRVLANAHDDISLAAVLRAPGCDFTVADLSRLRLAWPHSHYLIAALRASATGEPSQWSGPRAKEQMLEDEPGRALVRKCHRFREALDHWRELAQAGDLSAALATALAEAGMLESVAAMDAGAERLGNLQQLLAQARRYCQEQDHSLAGLIEHLAALEVSGGLESVACEEGSANAVQILSLHKAKGLEFPLVVLALLGRKFNTADAKNKVLIGRKWIGVDILDPGSYVKTPTIARRALAGMRKAEILEEEMRILYVAFTRAREKLIVTGTLSKQWEKLLAGLEIWAPVPPVATPSPVPKALLYGVGQPLDWILGMLRRADLLAGLDEGGAMRSGRTIDVARHSPQILSEKLPAPDHPPEAGDAATDAEAGGRTNAEQMLPALRQRIERQYAHATATRWRGKFWATEIKRLVDAAILDEEREVGSEFISAIPATADRTDLAPRQRLTAERLGPSPTEEGTWLHAILEALDFASLDLTAATASEGGAGLHEETALAAARELAQHETFPGEWVTAENIAPVTAFLGTPLAREMQASGADLEREASFSLKMHPGRLAEIWPKAAELDESEWVLVQGQIDALWPRPDGTLVILDFKSDKVASATEITERAAHYRPQILLYREAATRLWRAKRVECLLYFLRLGETVVVD